MMRWAIINEQRQVTDYRVTGGDFVYDPAEYGNLSDGLPAMRPVEELAKPAFNPATHELHNDRPVTVLDDKVTIGWTVVPRDPAIIAEEQRLAAIAAESDVNDTLSRLRTMSPAQINTWVDNNVGNIAQARAVFKAILKMLALRL